MGSKVISFRVSDDLYDEFERKCKDEAISPTVRLRKFVDNLCNPTRVDTDDKAQVKVINVEGKQADRVAGTNSRETKKHRFPLDFSTIFGKD